MTRRALFVAALAVLCPVVASQVAAEPVTITSGSIVFSEPGLFQAGSISIAGTRGFSLNGLIDSGETSVAPLRQCFPCEPTAAFSVGLQTGTFSFGGSAVATLDGKTFSDVNGLSSSTNVFLSLAGSTELPPVNGPSIVIRAPFADTPNSLFTFEVVPGTDDPALPPITDTVRLRARGIATVRFVANPTAPVWEFSSLRYGFQPTPEPATLLLVGGALLLFRARRGTVRKREDR